MTAAPVPLDDEARLAALHALRILDTPAEERFDRIVRFAADEFDVPIAMVSLVDRDRQWFKARVGVDACESARETSFCGHAIVQDDVLVVPDAQQDPRFADNPLVLGPPHIRFYAGAPLRLPTGERIGTLCLLDHRPRALASLDLRILCSLRRMVVQALCGEETGL